MTDWVRVKDKSTRHEYTVGVVDPDAHDILDKKEAADIYGNPLPAKPYVSKSAASATGQKATEKEGSA